MKIELYFPKKVISNVDLEKEFPGWKANKVASKIGIQSRHVADERETALDMAEAACRKLLIANGNPEIDFLLFCTQSPDYRLPTSACILQDRLALPKKIGAYDFNLGCSGFVYGLAQAKGLLAAGIASSVLLVTSETYTKYLHPHDRGNRSIFGDAAAACLLTREDGERIGQFILGTDGGGAPNLIIQNGGARNPAIRDVEEKEAGPGSFYTDNDLYMNGPEIFNFTIDVIPEMIGQVLEKNQMAVEDIDYFVFHQANLFMLDFLRKKIGIPEEKFVIDMEETGNTVSATIPIALKHLQEEGKCLRGTRVLLCGFGVGYSYGACVLSF